MFIFIISQDKIFSFFVQLIRDNFNFFRDFRNHSENTIVEEVGEYFLVIAATREACSLILPMPLCEEQIV